MTRDNNKALRRSRRGRLAAGTVLSLILIVTFALQSDRAIGMQTLLGTSTPAVAADPDQVGVELGVTFIPDVDGYVTALRFYKNPENRGPHVGTLWTGAGRQLARVQFPDESASGWQVVQLNQPIAVAKGHDYVASYTAPSGRYAAVEDAFSTTTKAGQLTLPAGAGVYTYSVGTFPTSRWKNSNYFVDVGFVASSSTAAPTVSPSATSTATPTATPTASPTATPTASPTATPTSSATAPAPTPTTSAPSGDDDLSLPKIAWEGGPDYWKKFGKADAAGWSDPSFFPISVWFNSIMTNEEVQYDKSLGVNTYIGMWEGTPYKLWEDNKVNWIGSGLNSTFTNSSKYWVGDFLDDEVDGRFTPAEGQAHLDRIKAQTGGNDRFDYANYTKMVAGIDLPASAASAYVNNYTDAVSLDQYFYTLQYCDWTPYRNPFLSPITQSNCRSSSSYGRAIDSLRTVDKRDGKLQPMWQFVENLNGGGLEAPFKRLIAPSELKGAVMNSIIHEARGIVYFNQSLTGPCQSSAVFRQAQRQGANFCGAAQVAAAKEVNLQVKALAPVINTQSYQYSFGSGLDTMLKARDGSVYVFAMVDGSSGPGQRNLTLPAEVQGRAVEVMFENRTIQADANGKFSDNFASESTYHIYKVSK